MLPSIEPSEVGATGLLWLLISYGYILYVAADLISEGSDLLLLVPAYSEIVGSVVLPLLGAVPDGAIMLFSGLGDKEAARESLAVGVGALAGSTIMLLTVPWALCVMAGRVKLGSDNKPIYKPPKQDPNIRFPGTLRKTGVIVSQVVQHCGTIMVITTIPYFLIQIPTSYLEGNLENDELVAKEKWYAFSGFLICIIGFVCYLSFQFYLSSAEQQKLLRINVMKKMIMKGEISLDGALYKFPMKEEAIGETTGLTSPQEDSMEEYLSDILLLLFKKYDKDGSGELDSKEITAMFRDYGIKLDKHGAKKVIEHFDEDHNGLLSFDEIVKAGCIIIRDGLTTHDEGDDQSSSLTGEEVDDVTQDITDLSPKEQQAIIKKKAFQMMLVGTILVLIFSDPMVDVLQEIAARSNIPAFYVAFVLAPLAANASEVIGSRYYAMKKTSKSITISLTTLEGAASMNNTFCLSILLGIVYFRGFAWHYTAETITIIFVELVLFIVTRKEVLTFLDGFLILLLFPLSIALVAVLENVFGFD